MPCPEAMRRPASPMAAASSPKDTTNAHPGRDIRCRPGVTARAYPLASGAAISGMAAPLPTPAGASGCGRLTEHPPTALPHRLIERAPPMGTAQPDRCAAGPHTVGTTPAPCRCAAPRVGGCRQAPQHGPAVEADARTDPRPPWRLDHARTRSRTPRPRRSPRYRADHRLRADRPGRHRARALRIAHCSCSSAMDQAGQRRRARCRALTEAADADRFWPLTGPFLCREACGSIRPLPLRASGCAAGSPEILGTRSLRSLTSRRDSLLPRPSGCTPGSRPPRHYVPSRQRNEGESE